MLNFYFDSTARIRQLRQGPLAEHLDTLAAEFQRYSYARLTARRMLSVIGQFNRYIRLVGVDVDDINEQITSRFLDDALVTDGLRAMRCLLDHLRRTNHIAPLPAAPPHPFFSVLDGFDRYLEDVRGLALSSRRRNVASARILIDWLHNRYCEEALTCLCGSDVLEFISGRLDRYTARSSRAHVCSQTRGFLKYLHASGTIAIDLTSTVPRVSTPRHSVLPRALPWEQVRALVDSIDDSHPDGLRDKAMFLLLALLGLRSGELRSLEFGHINWRAGEIHLPRTKASANVFFRLFTRLDQPWRTISYMGVQPWMFRRYYCVTGLDPVLSRQPTRLCI